MKYRVFVYFDGPRSQFGDKLHPCECIYTDDAPWLWLARSLAKGHVGNTGNCSYVITHNGKTIEQERPEKTSTVEVAA